MTGQSIGNPKLCATLAICLGSAVTVGCAVAAEPRFAEGKVRGVVAVAAIDEVSGLAASRNNPRVLWVHNDSGDRARIFAVSTRGDYLGEFELAGAQAFDCEDIAVGPGPMPGVDYIDLSDTGDNFSVRGGRGVIYRVPEPVVYADRGDQSRVLRTVDALSVRYPDGPHDAETLLCDPRSGDLYLITKRESRNRVYRAPAPGPGSQHIRLELMGAMAWTGSSLLGLPLYGAVGGDVSPDGREILRKRYHTASLHRRAPGEELSRALLPPAEFEMVPCNVEQQSEAIGFDARGRGYFTLGEGRNPKLIYYRRLSPDGPAVPRVLVPAGSKWARLDLVDDPGAAWRTSSDQPPPAAASPSVSARPPTTYYRIQFDAHDPGTLGDVTLKLHCGGGGAAVYLSGVEIARVNLPADAGHDAPAPEAPYELRDTWITVPLDQTVVRDALHEGENVLAVEVHDPPGRLQPVPFDLQLVAMPARVVPEPTTVGMLAVLAAASLSYVWWRRRRRRA